jgi:hypothetical protein
MADAMQKIDDAVGMDEIFSGPEDKSIAIPAPHDSLAVHIRSVWQLNWQAKQVVEQRELANERRFNGEYDPDRLAAIKDAGLPEDTLRMTYHKCRDCASWMLDTIDPLGDRTWDVETDGKIEIPPELKDQLIQQKQMEMLQAAMQQAQQTGQQIDPYQVVEMIKASEEEIIELILDEAKGVAEGRCTNMERLIMSQQHEGGWDEAYKACIDDFSRRKAAFMKGPLPKNVKSLKWDESSQKYVIVDKVVPGYWRINSFDCYPAPNALNTNDGSFIELEHHDVTDLSKLVGKKGYDSDAIRKILQRFPKGRREITVIDQERKWLENEDIAAGQDNVVGGKIDGLYFWGDVQGKLLKEWGMKEKDVPDEDIYYPVAIRMVDDIVFQARINPDPLGRNPYDSASFVKNNDSIWGESPCDLMEGIENLTRATIRHMMSNVAISSGPVWEEDESRLAADDNGDIYPNKVVMMTNKRFMEGPGLRMIQAKLNAAELLMVFDKFKKEADDQVVPAFANSAGGGERTTSALGIRMSAAGRNINMAIDNYDQGIIQQKMQKQFTWDMLNVDDPTIKGTTRIVARSTKSQSAREQIANRQMEFIDRISRNPELAGIAGKKGMAYGMGEAAKGLGWSVKQLIPNLEAIEKSPNQPIDAQSPQGQSPAPSGQILDASGQPAGGVESQKGPVQ